MNALASTNNNVPVGIEIQANNDINTNIKILALELVMLKSDIRAYVYDNKKGNKSFTLNRFRDKLDKLYTLCVYENIKGDLKIKISKYLNTNVKPTEKTLIYSIDIFDSLFTELKRLGKI